MALGFQSLLEPKLSWTATPARGLKLNQFGFWCSSSFFDSEQINIGLIDRFSSDLTLMTWRDLVIILWLFSARIFSYFPLGSWQGTERENTLPRSRNFPAILCQKWWKNIILMIQTWITFHSCSLSFKSYQMNFSVVLKERKHVISHIRVHVWLSKQRDGIVSMRSRDDNNNDNLGLPTYYTMKTWKYCYY